MEVDNKTILNNTSNKKDVSETKNPIQSAQRIFEVMETLSITGPIALIELSNILGLHKSTTHRLLMSLIFMGYVKQDEENGKYMLSLKILNIASRLLRKIDILSISKPFITKLVEQTGETVHLVQRNGNDMVYIDKVESEVSSIRMVSQVGKSVPMYCSGVGKAILATLSKEEVTKIWNQSKIEKFTEHTMVSLDQLLEELDEVRQKGYALDNEENELGVRCIAACIKDYQGEANHAFSISAPVGRMSDNRIKELSYYVLEMKNSISREFGYVE